jgi:hypothetical protein
MSPRTTAPERRYDSVPVPPDIPEGWAVTTATGPMVGQAEALEYSVFSAA